VWSTRAPRLIPSPPLRSGEEAARRPPSKRAAAARSRALLLVDRAEPPPLVCLVADRTRFVAAASEATLESSSAFVYRRWCGYLGHRLRSLFVDVSRGDGVMSDRVGRGVQRTTTLFRLCARSFLVLAAARNSFIANRSLSLPGKDFRCMNGLS
ncbi:hypothetical protein MRX96_021344, partial [Rhipicephalus microplus]